MKKLEERIEKNEDLKATASSYAVERGGAGAEDNQQLTDLNCRLQEMVDASAKLEQKLNRRVQDATSASAADLARWEQEVKKEREQAGVEHNQQLIDINRRLQDEANASAAHRTRLDEEIKALLDRVTTVYVQVPFCLVTHDD